MQNQRNFKERPSQTEQKINAQLEIVEMRFNQDMDYAETRAEMGLKEGARRADVERAAAEQKHDAIYHLFLSVARIPGITVPRAKAAVNEIFKRAGIDDRVL